MRHSVICFKVLELATYAPAIGYRPIGRVDVWSGS